MDVQRMRHTRCVSSRACMVTRSMRRQRTISAACETKDIPNWAKWSFPRRTCRGETRPHGLVCQASGAASDGASSRRRSLACVVCLLSMSAVRRLFQSSVWRATGALSYQNSGQLVLQGRRPICRVRADTATHRYKLITPMHSQNLTSICCVLTAVVDC